MAQRSFVSATPDSSKHRRRPAPRRSAVLVIALAAVVLLAGCSGNEKESSEDREAPPGAAESASELEATWAEFEDAIDIKPRIDPVPTDPKTSLFTKSGLKVFTDKAQEVMEKTTDSRVVGLEPDAAVRYVLTPELTDSVNDTIATEAKWRGGLNWQWQIASIYQTTPTKPVTLRSVWSVTTRTASFADGDHPVLTVALQNLILQRVEDANGDLRPIVVRRTVTVTGGWPDDPEIWVAVRVLTNPYGNDGCQLRDDNTLTPGVDPIVLRMDLTNMKVALSTSGYVNNLLPTRAPTAAEMRKVLKQNPCPPPQ